MILIVGALMGGSRKAEGIEAAAVAPGELFADPPTLINLGFEWVVTGDTNRNAKVEVSYRKKGDTVWKNAMPLMRMNGERIYATDRAFDVVSPNMFAGSILDLEPDTTYEARLTLTDPDGASGETTRVVTVKTRAEPKPAAGGKIFHVYPPDWKGAREAGSFNHLMCAYNYYCGGGGTDPAGQSPGITGGIAIALARGCKKPGAQYTRG